MTEAQQTRRRYFEAEMTSRHPRQWHLGVPRDAHRNEIDVWTFQLGKPANVEGPLFVPLQSRGTPLDFTFGSFKIPVVTSELALALKAIAPTDLELIPARIEPAPSRQDYYVVNVLSVIPCIDEANSGITRWTERDGVPDKVGQYFGVAHLRIDPSRVGRERVFRVKEWMGPIIVAEEVKDLIEVRKNSGVDFIPVGGDRGDPDPGS